MPKKTAEAKETKAVTANKVKPSPPDAVPEATKGIFSLQRIYIKDVSYEAPNTPGIFAADAKAAIDTQLEGRTGRVGDNLFEVVLSVTVTVKAGETTAYLIEVKQAGVFRIEGVSEAILQKMLATTCLDMLFPFAREAVSDLAVRGGFPQLLLAPIQFEALYRRQRQAGTQQQQTRTQQRVGMPEAGSEVEG